MPLYLAMPLRLKFHQNDYRHTVAEARHWENHSFTKSLSGQLKASCKPDAQAAEFQLIEDAAALIRQHTQDTRVRLEDFTLDYTVVSFDEEGRAYVPDGLLMDHRYKPEPTAVRR